MHQLSIDPTELRDTKSRRDALRPLLAEHLLRLRDTYEAERGNAAEELRFARDTLAKAIQREVDAKNLATLRPNLPRAVEAMRVAASIRFTLTNSVAELRAKLEAIDEALKNIPDVAEQILAGGDESEDE